jgi:pimeloyl-ACP methyl ester carboxylesterase
MTITAPGPRVVERVVEVGGIPVSARVCEAPDPRAIVLAVHGGATTSRYFDAPGLPRLSFLRAAAMLGFTVVAPDRPGYGGSAAFLDAVASARQRVDLVYEAVELLLAPLPRGAGTFVMAHSRGCGLAMQMVCDDRGTDFLGLEIAGIGRDLGLPAMALRKVRRDGGRGGTRIRELLWEPARLHPAELGGGDAITAPGPAYDGVEAEEWAEVFPELAARVKVPVHYTLGDHERWWRTGRAALADIAGLFTASPRVVTDEQAQGGHNLSVGLSAASYHLKVLSFVEECILNREMTEG